VRQEVENYHEISVQNIRDWLEGAKAVQNQTIAPLFRRINPSVGGFHKKCEIVDCYWHFR